MPFNLATLNTKLDTKLGDAADAAWTSDEKDDLIKDAVAALWPRVSRPLDPDQNAVALTTNVFFYPLPYGVAAVSRADWIADDGFVEHGELDNGLWSVEGDPLSPEGGLLRVDPRIANQGGTLRLYGYGRFDTASNPISQDHVAFVMAHATAAAYRRLVGDRARYTAWLSRNPAKNTSVNELVQMIADADRDVARERLAHKVWQRPVPGRA